MKNNVKGVWLVLAMLAIPCMVFAGITGKISGRVTDADTRQPLPGANVIVVGTDMGTATGTDGSYSLSSVPVGTYDVEVSMMGYQAKVIKGVSVSADKVTSLNVQIKEGSGIVMGTVEVTAQKDIVSKDPNVGKITKGSEIVRSAGVSNYNDVVALQAGATETSGNSGGLHVQGGRANELVYVVDGINANDPVTGQSGVYIDNTAIQEMTINTGSFNAEYGDAMSGIVNIVTREGSEKFRAGVEYETDAHLRLSDNPVQYPNPDMWHNKVSLFVSGPFWGQGTKISAPSFYISGNLLEDEDRLPANDNHRKNGTLKLTWRPVFGGPKFTLSGNYSDQWYHAYLHDFSKGIWLDEFGPRVKADNYQLNLKVSGPLGRDSAQSLTYTVNVGTFNTHRSVSYMDGAQINDYRMIGRQLMPWVGWAYNETWWEPNPEVPGDSILRRLYNPDSMNFYIPDSMLAYVDGSDSVYVDVNERYSKITKDPDSAVWLFYNEFIVKNGYFYEGDNNFNWFSWEEQLEAYNERWYSINEWRPTVDANGDTVGLHYHMFDFARYQHYYELYREWKPDTTVPGWKEVENPYEDSLETSGNMYVVRYNDDPVFRRFNYYFNPVWSDRNTTKYVADASIDWSPNKEHWAKFGLIGNYHVLDYTSIQFINENPYTDMYHKQPIIAAAYAQDKFQLEDLLLNFGLRFDYFDPASQYFVNPEYVDSGTAEAKPKFQFSPRLSISFSVSDKSTMYASYGHFFQPIELQELYQNLNGDLSSGVPLLGNPNLPPLKTVFYQAGYNIALTRFLGLDLKAYYKDQENLLATRNVNTIYKGKLATYTIYTIEDFAKIKGFDITVNGGEGLISGSVTYSYMDAKGTGSSGREFYYRYRGSALQQPKSEYPLEFDITHSVKANVNFFLPDTFGVKVLRNTNLNIQFNYASGPPYWASDSRGNPLPLGSKRQPGTKTVDMKLEKWFPLGKNQNLNLGFYIDVSNVFNWANASSVYGATGLPDDPGTRPVYQQANYSTYAQYGFADEYEYWQADVADWERYYAQNPDMFGEPRLINFGLRLNFN